ncbi:hypothetical protein J2W49_003017 [Hydrogenophaga palleronii]|uniref:Lipoprotein n=1 Tax=Hydrogenophaga palleronii TaxID=65655 RepID=A0ABU1WPS9_9BURK|nr:hypothetical protein [Hydrogenophaga palleronii]MDR7151044.1 hypothetical protein [Hydrogenophaga palleronii]
MKVAKAIGLLAVAVLAAACGGGGDEAGDVGEMSVFPTKQTIGVESCVDTRRTVDVVHTINGGQPPFRIQPSLPQLFEIGTIQVVNNTRQYVALPLQGDGFVELRGKDPQFVVRTLLGAGCVNPATITVLDVFSNSVLVEYVIEAEEEEGEAEED